MLRNCVGARAGARIFMVGLLATTMLATANICAAQAQVSAQNFSIPAQSLDSAMAAFSRATRMQVLTLGTTTQGVRSPGVQGTLRPEQALTAILAGTGLVAQFAGGNTVTLVDPKQSVATGDLGAGDAIVLEPIEASGGSGAGAEPEDAPYQTPGSSSYISAEQIDRLPGSTAGDIFKSTPGVIAASNHNGGASVDVNIRGLQGQNRVKVAIDGTQQSTTTWRGYAGVDDRTYIDPDLIGGVAIEKGPTSSAEGAGVTGGVVAIRTLNAKDIVAEGQEYGARLRVGTSDNATNDIRVNAFDQSTDRPDLFDFENGAGSAAVATRQENFDFVAAFARRKSGNYFTGTEGETHYTYNNTRWPLSFTKPGEEAFNTSEDSLSALVKGTIYWGDEHSLELGYTHFESEFGEAIGSLLVAQDTTWRQVNLAEAETNTFTARYRWKPLDNDLYDLRANVWMSDIEATTRSVGPAFYFPPFLTPAMRPPADDPRLNETTMYGADITNTSRVDTSFGLVKADYGASYVLEDMYGHEYYSRIYQNEVGALMQPSVGTREIASLFSRGEWEINDWLTVSSGLRYDAYRIDEKGEPQTVGTYADKEGGRFNPSASVTVSPFDGVQIYGLYSEGVRPPSLRELIGSDSLLAPNPDLEPEIAKNWEFGVNYLADSVFEEDDRLRMKLAYFHNNYEDYISRVSNRTPVVPGAPRPF
jgi:hemoglobin/transferrin/lactoferrin receptor protein